MKPPTPPPQRRTQSDCLTSPLISGAHLGDFAHRRGFATGEGKWGCKANSTSFMTRADLEGQSWILLTQCPGQVSLRLCPSYDSEGHQFVGSIFYPAETPFPTSRMMAVHQFKPNRSLILRHENETNIIG